MTNTPHGEELSSEAHQRIETYLGLSKADEVAADVRDGEISATAADEWSRSIEANFERSRDRPEIEPEDWRKAEDGWRPDGFHSV